MTDTLDNAAEAILLDAIVRIDWVATVECKEQQSREFARFLVLEDLWQRLTQALQYSPDDLREKADGMEEEDEDEGEG